MRFLIAVAFASLTPLMALQKVLILPIVNINHDANYAYLEGAISDSLKDRLRQKFAFEELPEEKWKLVAEQNFILRDDFYTQTAAMNLGILANQDIVISGGFRPETKTSGVGKGKTVIRATAYLLDVKKKKMIATIKLDLPADSELFTAVGTVADRIEEEARKVIPSKEDAARSGLKADSEPLFADWSIGLKGGGGVYVAGYAKNFTAQLPAFGAEVKTHIPKLSRKFTTHFEFIYLSHKLKEGSDSALQSLGASSTTTNYILSLALGYQISIATKFFVEPFIGGGYVLQSTSVTGSGINSSLSNSFPLAKAGAQLGYRINAAIDVSLSLVTLAYIEQSVVTLAPVALAGVHYKLQ